MAMLEQTNVSERRACLLVDISRTVLHYMPKVRLENEQLQGRMVELASERRRFGYRRIHVLLRREGVEANHKRIFRLYQAAGLAVKRRRRGAVRSASHIAYQISPINGSFPFILLFVGGGDGGADGVFVLVARAISIQQNS